MHKSTVTTLAAIVIIIIAALVALQFNHRQVLPASHPAALSTTASPSASTTSGNFSYNCSPDTTAFVSLQKSASSIKYQSSSYGKLITEINGISQGNGKYWIYSVNGNEATVGAEAYHCQGNEKIDWELK